MALAIAESFPLYVAKSGHNVQKRKNLCLVWSYGNNNILQLIQKGQLSMNLAKHMGLLTRTRNCKDTNNRLLRHCVTELNLLIQETFEMVFV